jgi:hypothetical protein
LSEDRPLITVDGAIWGLGLTAAAYRLAFQYESGYAIQLGLPFSLIDVSLDSLYGSLMWVGLMAGIVFVVETLVVGVLEGMLKIKASVLIRWFTAGALLYALLAALFHVRFAWYLSGGLIVVLTAALIGPIFTVKKRTSYTEKVAISDARLAASVFPPHVSQRLAFVIVALIIVATAFQVAWEAGRSEARDQQQFLVADASPPCVIINAHGDHLVCAEFADGRLLGQFRFLSKTDRDLKLKLKKVGPLQPVAERS